MIRVDPQLRRFARVVRAVPAVRVAPVDIAAAAPSLSVLVDPLEVASGAVAVDTVPAAQVEELLASAQAAAGEVSEPVAAEAEVSAPMVLVPTEPVALLVEAVSAVVGLGAQVPEVDVRVASVEVVEWVPLEVVHLA